MASRFQSNNTGVHWGHHKRLFISRSVAVSLLEDLHSAKGMCSCFSLAVAIIQIKYVDIMVSVPKCPDKWLYFRSITLTRAYCFLRRWNRSCKTWKVADFLTKSDIIFFWYIRYLPLLARDRDVGSSPCGQTATVKAHFAHKLSRRWRR